MVSELWVTQINDKILWSNSFVWAVNTVFALLWVTYHFLSKKTEDDFTSVPPSIYLHGVMLTCMSLWPFMTNLALRQFTVKMIKIKLNYLFWSPKQQTSKGKSQNILNVPMPKKNQRKVDFIEVPTTRSTCSTRSTRVDSGNQTSQLVD